MAQLLDEATGGPRHHHHSTLDGELGGYVRMGERLRGSVRLLPDPAPEFRSSLRAMLVATAEREGIGSTAIADSVPANGGKRFRSTRPVMSSRRARGAILVGLAAGTLALSGMSAASTNAMPGDPLYGVKRSTESARLALAGSPVSKGQLYLEFARNRLTEARGTRSTDAAMFDDMDSETRAAVKLLTGAALQYGDPTALDAIDGFVQAQRPDLVGLGDDARVRQSVALLDTIARRSADLRTSVACGAGPASAEDDLGALAPSCHEPAKPNRSGGSGRGPVGHPGPAGSTDPSTAPSVDTGTDTGTTSPASPSPSPSGLLDNLIHGII